MSDPSHKPFDMPPVSAGFDARGGWVVNRLMAEARLGLTNPIHAAAIVGNLGGESGLKAINETHPMVPGSRGGWSWAQWTGDRRVNFEAFCANKGYPVTSDQGAYEFLILELLGDEKHALDQTKKTTTLDAAVETFEILFERPSDPQGGLPSRVSFAHRALVAAGHPVLAAVVQPAPQPNPIPAPISQPAPPVVRAALGTTDVIDAAVRLMQTVLTVAAYYKGPIDGYPNEEMYRACEDYRIWLDEQKP